MQMSQLLDAVRAEGYRLTPQRRMILRALLHSAKPLSASALHEMLQPDYPELGVDTVYRNLRLLEALRLVSHIHLDAQHGDLYELSGGHHHHRICLECGAVECLERCPVDGEISVEAEASGFKVTGHVFEIYGCCAECRAARRQSSGSQGQRGRKRAVA